MRQVNMFALSLLFLALASESFGIYQSVLVPNSPHPYVVSIRNDKSHHIESGTIISIAHVLAFAWTIRSHNPKSVEAGSLTLDQGQIYNVKRTLIHPHYDTKGQTNAIGIILIEGQFQFSDLIQAAPLESVFIGANVPLLAVGWGGTEFTISEKQLRQAHFYSLSDEECQQSLAKANWSEYYHENVLCAKGFKRRQKWCYYDFGSPLLASGIVVGITHNPTNCDRNTENVNLATKIEPYLTWIEEQLRTFGPVEEHIGAHNATVEH